MSEAILSATNLWLRRGERELFNGYSLQLHAADVLWLRAPNGRGKTTLLRILAGLVTPETGRLSWRGQGFASRMDESRQAIGFLDERLGLSRDLSVADNLRYIADTCATQTAVAIDALELAPLLARRVGQLSTGQKKRVGMARLLLENAAVWLLDEPANGLDDRYASVSGKFGSVIRGIRDNEARVRFLGYPVEHFKLFVFVLTAVIAGIAGALYYPQAGIINPAEVAPIASIYLAVWVAIGGRGRLYGAVIGAAFVSLVSTWFTGGQVPSVDLGFYRIDWVEWWLVILGLSFVLVTLFAPKGIGGLFDLLTERFAPNRHGRNYGPDQGALMEREGRK